MMQLKAYSQLTDETLDIGLPDDDVEALLELGETMATGREDGIIVYVENPPLQPWEDA